MERAGEILVATLAECAGQGRSGRELMADLDQLAECFNPRGAGVPTFKGLPRLSGSICASPNAMVVHGNLARIARSPATSSRSTSA